MATSDVQPDESGAIPVAPSPKKTGKALENVSRALTDDELASSGARKMLLEELGRLTDENSDLRSYRDRFYDAEKRLGILQEKLKPTRSIDILSGGCILVGGLMIGSHKPGDLALIVGWILVIVGIVAKVVII
jgi:hypothetical protein